MYVNQKLSHCLLSIETLPFTEKKDDKKKTSIKSSRSFQLKIDLLQIGTASLNKLPISNAFLLRFNIKLIINKNTLIIQ